MPSQFFDASNDPHRESDSRDAGGPANPFLGVQYKCCWTYGRLYRNKSQTAYEGHCPKCGAKLSVPIGPGGTGQRFFSAG